MNSEATIVGGQSSTQKVDFRFEDSIGTFLLTPNMASHLSGL